MTARACLAIALALAPRLAVADDDPWAEDTTVATTAGDPATAPLPGDESGRIDEPTDHDSTARRVGRALLFVPRGLFEVVMFPIRAGVWVTDRYDLYARLRALLMLPGGRVGVLPWGRHESGFGFLVGARLALELSDTEVLRVTAAGGGEYRWLAAISLRTRSRPDDMFGGRASLKLDGQYMKRPDDRFFGIGNGDEVDIAMVPIDALVDDTAVKTRYRERSWRGRVAADLRVASDLHLRVAGELADLKTSPSDTGPPIDVVYMPESLVGFGNLSEAYGELEVRWDSRGSSSLWEPYALDSRGWLLSAFGGRAAIEDSDGFWRYGVDVQRFIRIDEGPRVLAARLHGEAVTGARSEVPFIDLPTLGGASLLRGYEYERFRDRVAVVGSLEYEWDLSRIFFASVFVDVGRVYPGLDDLTFDELRCGFGTAIEAHSSQHFRTRFAVASSVDGGVQFYLSFGPVFQLPTRVGPR